MSSLGPHSRPGSSSLFAFRCISCGASYYEEVEWCPEPCHTDLRDSNNRAYNAPRVESGLNRESIQATYDHRETGDRFTIETRVNGRRVSETPLPDPFATHRVTNGWRDLLASLLRRKLVVEVIVGGDAEVVEDVCELNADYAGRHGSTRREQWRDEVEKGLRGV